MTMVMAICLWGILARVGPVGFTIGFLPTFIIILTLGWTGRFDRLWPAALATLIVAIWPVYRWLALGDWAVARAFLYLAGFIDAVLLMSIGIDFATRRGWIVESPTRNRVNLGLILTMSAKSLIGLPAGAWSNALTYAFVAAIFLSLFWPARKPAIRASAT